MLIGTLEYGLVWPLGLANQQGVNERPIAFYVQSKYHRVAG
jgi:hypothetical protein